jgi:hypothetical protein
LAAKIRFLPGKMLEKSVLGYFCEQNKNFDAFYSFQNFFEIETSELAKLSRYLPN